MALTVAPPATLHIFHLVVSVFGAIASPVAAPMAKPNCSDSCGGVQVPYPFGIGPNCSFNQDFTLRCNTSANPPVLKKGGLEIVSMSLDGEISVNMDISYQCFDSQGQMNKSLNARMNLNLDNSFTFSNTKNKFTAIGCDTFGRFTGNWGKNFKAGCVSYCADEKSVADHSCDGIGCCQTAIPKGVTSVGLDLSSFYNYTQFNGKSDSHRCSYAFLGDPRDFEFRAADVMGTNFLEQRKGVTAVVLEWALGNETNLCKSSKGSRGVCAGGECYIPDDGIGYRCRCKAGYDGNPYLADGCLDVNECANGTHDCQNVAYCENTVGAYECICPKGYSGDGRKHEGRSGCVLASRRELFKEMIIAPTVSAFLLIVGISWTHWMCNKRKLIKEKQKFFKQNGGSLLHQLSSSNATGMDIIKIFTAGELEKATNNYHTSNIVGVGGHGTVYKGILHDNRIVAIKKAIIVDRDQVNQFINEIVILFKMNHRNVVKLLGCCLETEAPLLVYEFIPNGTLFHHVHHKDHASSLSFDSRLRIAGESAGALAFLHSAASIPIIHRDVKSANILLDNHFTAKVSDFGASRLVPLDVAQVTTLVQGTLGYLDPEYFQTGQLSDKSDVYSFGVVLVELLTGAKPICSTRTEEERSLSMYFIAAMKKNGLFQVLADEVVNEDIGQLVAVAELARNCLKMKGEDRPTMKEVVAELDRLRALRQHPWTDSQNQEQEQILLGHKSDESWSAERLVHQNLTLSFGANESS